MLAAVRPAYAESDVAGMELDGLFAADRNRFAAELQIKPVMIQGRVGDIPTRSNDLIARTRLRHHEAKRTATSQRCAGGKHTWRRLCRHAKETRGGLADNFTPVREA